LIRVSIKLFSGIPQELKLTDYDLSKGIELSVERGTRLKRVLKDLGLTRFSSCVFFCGGERIAPGHKLQDGDEVTCVRPAGGG
jgi:sulfur carrier protein ThiS